MKQECSTYLESIGKSKALATTLSDIEPKKLSEVELECEKLSIKVDEANQTIKALRFENNFREQLLG